MIACKKPICFCPLALLAALSLHAQTPPDLISNFDAGTDDWLASEAIPVFEWRDTGGTDGGYLHAQGDGTTWHFQSPPSWSGDWSGYRALRFEYAIPSRHYATNDLENMVEIEGANGTTLLWNGPTPIWNWTPFVISLEPSSFAVDQTTFDGVMANVAEVRILGELVGDVNETVGLDSVRLTATPPQVFTGNLIERFDDATVDPADNSVAGWSPVDDVTFSVEQFGQPAFCLHGDDWRDGRLFKIASPDSWAGDWSGFVELAFDFQWSTGGAGLENATLVTIYGANGTVLSWSTDLPNGEWKRHRISLTPATFGVSQEVFDGVMSYVNQIRIHGEFDSSDDQAYLDNVMLLTAPYEAPVFTNNLISRFGSDDEGWLGYDNCALSWEAEGGRSTGFIVGQDVGSGVATLQSPSSWSGDWRNFSELRFFIKVLGANRAGFNGTVTIVTWDGTSLEATLPLFYRSWTPYTLELTPETFGVMQQEFDAVMSDVAALRIRTDLVNGTGAADRTGIDEVALLIDPQVGSAPPPLASDFESGAEGWRGNGLDGTTWTFATSEALHETDTGNPGGCITLNDAAGLAGWFSPESWSGDWRGYESLSLDINIFQGTNLLNPDWMVVVISPQGDLVQSIANVPQPLTWTSYQFPLNAAAFGVTQDEYEKSMRDVTALFIRSEWVNGAELEALDNVRLDASAGDAYQVWLSGFLSAGELADEAISGQSADPDKDGATNWEEYLALTDPTDSSSRFVATGVAQESGYAVEFEAKVGRVYQVYRSLDLQTSWTPVGPVITGDDSMKTHLDNSGEPEAFFQVEVSLP